MIPSELQRIVTKALRKERERRYQTIADLMLDLKVLRDELQRGPQPLVDAQAFLDATPWENARDGTTTPHVVVCARPVRPKPFTLPKK